MRKHLPIIVLLLASIAVHFAFYGSPKQTVFDEVHFGKFASGYFTREYFFDIHPPLGKLLVSGAGYLVGFQPGFSFGSIGDRFPDNTYLALRLLPTLAGTLLPLIIYLLVMELGMSRKAAFAAGMLIVLENALLVQSKFILLDAFLLLFGFLAWLMYAKYRHRQKLYLLVLAAACAGLAVSVKWTGATFLLIILVLEIKRWRNWFVLLIVPFAIYYALFTIHFSLLTKPGPGDAFMSQQFQEGKLSAFDKFIELNKVMYTANAGLTATHPYSSKWYSWPFMTRGIYYWNGSSTGTEQARIYLVGNPVIWWASTFAIIYVIMSSVTIRNKFLILLSGAYLVNMLPFIGIARALFLYHYFIGLIVAIIALVYLIDQLPSLRQGFGGLSALNNLKVYKKTAVFGGLILISLISFLYFAPLSYGRPLTNSEFQARMWLKSWE